MCWSSGGKTGEKRLVGRKRRGGGPLLSSAGQTGRIEGEEGRYIGEREKPTPEKRIKINQRE